METEDEDYKREQRLVGEIDAVIKRSGENPEIVFWALRGAIGGLMSEVDADVRVRFAAELQRAAWNMLDVADMIAFHKKNAPPPKPSSGHA